MKLNPIINATRERSATPELDHVLVVLPTVSGSDEFVSISTYEDLVNTFGIHYALPKTNTEFDKDDEEYSALLLSSLKYILDGGVPLLCASVKSSVNAAIRIYYLPDKAQPWYVCSIAHKSLPQGLRDLPQNLHDFFQFESIVGFNSLGTICHSLPLNRRKDEEGNWVTIEDPEDTSNARFITLPIQDMENPDTPMVPYCILLENNGLELGTANEDLYSNMSPIQVTDYLGNKSSLVMKCHGSNSEIYDEVTRINQILESLNSSREASITRWICVFDESENRLLFISNQYIYSAGSYSIYGGLDFDQDFNISGALLDDFTKEYAVLDINSKLSGNIGNEFRIKFDKSSKGNFVRVYQLSNQLESLEFYDSDIDLNHLLDSEYLNFIKYENPNYPDLTNIFSDSYFKDKKFNLSGGVDFDEFSFEDMGRKLNEYVDYEDDIYVDFIYDCMATHLDYHKCALEAVSSFINEYVRIITNGDLSSGELGYNYYTNQHRFVFYDNTPVTLETLEKVSLGAIIIERLHKYDYLPNIQAVLTDDYLNKIKLHQNTDVIVPEVDHQIVYLNELKIAGLDLESSIDQYLLSFLKNELRYLFNHNLVGYVHEDFDKLLDATITILEHSSVAPNLILSYSIEELSQYESVVFLSLRVYREEISGGIRNLYININL
jgi:hypothetical protein